MNSGEVKTVIDNSSDIETWIVGGAIQPTGSSDESPDSPKVQKVSWPRRKGRGSGKCSRAVLDEFAGTNLGIVILHIDPHEVVAVCLTTKEA